MLAQGGVDALRRRLRDSSRRLGRAVRRLQPRPPAADGAVLRARADVFLRAAAACVALAADAKLLGSLRKREAAVQTARAFARAPYSNRAAPDTARILRLVTRHASPSAAAVVPSARRSRLSCVLAPPAGPPADCSEVRWRCAVHSRLSAVSSSARTAPVREARAEHASASAGDVAGAVVMEDFGASSGYVAPLARCAR